MSAPVINKIEYRRKRDWSVANAPGAGAVAATITVAAIAGIKHIITELAASIVVVVAGGAGAGVVLSLTDSAGSIGATWDMAVTSTLGDKDRIVISGLNIECAMGASVTLAFNNDPGTCLESVQMSGYDAVT